MQDKIQKEVESRRGGMQLASIELYKVNSRAGHLAHLVSLVRSRCICVISSLVRSKSIASASFCCSLILAEATAQQNDTNFASVSSVGLGDL